MPTGVLRRSSRSAMQGVGSARCTGGQTDCAVLNRDRGAVQKYDTAATAYQRVLDNPDVPKLVKTRSPASTEPATPPSCASTSSRCPTSSTWSRQNSPGSCRSPQRRPSGKTGEATTRRPRHLDVRKRGYLNASLCLIGALVRHSEPANIRRAATRVYSIGQYSSCSSGQTC